MFERSAYCVAADSKPSKNPVRLVVGLWDAARNWWEARKKKGPKVTPDNALSLSDIMTCVRVLAESMASLPLDLYRQGERGGEKAREHRLFELLRWQPNPEMTAYELKLWLMIDALLRGTGCAQVRRNRDGEIIQLWPLFRSKLQAMRTPGGELVFKYPAPDEGKSKSSSKWIYLEANEVLLLKAFGSPGVFGPSLIDLGSDLFSGAKAAEQYTQEFFTNGSAFSGTVEVPEVMDDETFERFKKDWDEAHSGEGKRHKTPILEGGAKFNPAKLNHQESQMIEARKFTRSQVAGYWRVPAHLINDLEKATFSNIEHQDLGFVKHTLRPWMANLEQRCRMTLLSPEEKTEGYYFRHNVNDMLRGDLASRMTAHATAVQNGILSPNDVRRKEDEPTYDGGDTYFINSASVPVEVAKEAKPQNQAA